MQTQKMSLANIKGKLSRAEMKKIMAGCGSLGCACGSDSDCGSGAPHCNKNKSCDDGKTYGACEH